MGICKRLRLRTKGRLNLHHILKMHRVMFCWRLAHSTSKFLPDILWCCFYDGELIIIF